MAKNVYMIVTDLHFGNIAASSRLNYRKEVEFVKCKLLETAIKYRSNGCTVKMLLLGDIFHGSYRDVTDALVDFSFFTMWREKIGEIYTVLGNHELTYYKANPFYALINKMESEAVQKIINKVWTPLGLSNTIRVVDKLEDGNVDFYFNHSSTAVQSVSVNDDKVAIGLFHQDLIDPAIVEEMKNRYGNEYYGLTRELDNAYELTGYNHCFFGHIHTAYGIWKAGDVYLHYLASLGRTNEREVNDSMLERNIPCIVVEDDRFVAIEDNFVVLPDRKTCISESNVIENRQEYQERKTVRELRDYVPIADDPVSDVKALFRGDSDAERILYELADGRCSWLISLNSKLRGLGIS